MEEKKWKEYPELEYFFCQIEGVGFRTLKKLFDAVPNLEKAYELSQKQMEELLGTKAAELIAERRKQGDPLQMWKQLRQQEILFASYWNPSYPKDLRCIQDPPKALYALGKMPAAEERRVALIGARACSEYGRRMARTLGEELAGQGVVVVSGMARGIDGISQRYALEAGGTSYAVLGCGVDICYPKENRVLYEKLCRQGGVLSEYVPGTEAKAHLFPPRNRIISALSDVIVVVEARKKSGTIITVDMALEQGKEVMVVPGRVGDGLSEGCNDLLKYDIQHHDRDGKAKNEAAVALKPVLFPTQHTVPPISRSYLSAALERTQKRHLVGVFQLAADRNAVSQPRHTDADRTQEP